MKKQISATVKLLQIFITPHHGPAVPWFLGSNGLTNGAGCLRGLLRLIRTYFENISGCPFWDRDPKYPSDQLWPSQPTPSVCHADQRGMRGFLYWAGARRGGCARSCRAKARKWHFPVNPKMVWDDIWIELVVLSCWTSTPNSFQQRPP